jgi:RNA polymerase sigma factor (sigma-70 family)
MSTIDHDPITIDDHEPGSPASCPGDPPGHAPAGAHDVAPLSEGTRAWVAEAYDRSHDLVAGMVERRSVAPESARDIEQDAYLTLIERAARGLVPDNTEAMLVTIVGHLFCNQGRRRIRRRAFDDDACLDDLPANAPDVEQQVLAFQYQRIVEAALARMTPAARELIRLIDLGGHSVAEAAAIVGRDEKAVGLQHWRALRRFEELAAPLVAEELRRAV